MTLTIELTPEQESRLAALARREGLEPADIVKKLVEETERLGLYK
jgi:predicted DNA-binding protein